MSYKKKVELNMESGPDFIIPGASKSGTTSLHHYLNEHEEIFLPQEKELRFFDKNPNYTKGLEYYEKQFKGGEDCPAVGEASPAYFYHGIVYNGPSHKDYAWEPDDDAPIRIRDAYPDVKLIITLRNPATRAYSQYWKNYRQGRERASSFAEAIEEEIEGKRDHRENPWCWVYRNRYPVHLRHWLDLFDRDQIMFMVFEEWVDSPEEALNNICEFLGVKPKESWSRTQTSKNPGGTPRMVFLNRFYQKYIRGTPAATALRKTRITHVLDSLNTSEGYPDMSEKDLELMQDVFEEDILETEELIGKDLDVWRDELSI
jgi:hypothetical protein